MANSALAGQVTSEEQNEIARREAREADRVEPRAETVKYDPMQRLVFVA